MVPLSHCPGGATVRIEKLCDDPRCRCHLCALGLTPGMEAQVRSGGPACRLYVRGGEVCLGDGLADAVLVTRLGV